VSLQKQTGTGEKLTKKLRLEILKQGTKLAGSKAKYLPDEILLAYKSWMKLRNCNYAVMDYLLKIKKYIDSMRVNATMENLSKG
jgi:hypothetical protein